MKRSVIAGVDVSKSTLDIHLKPYDVSIRIPNTPAGFRRWLKDLKQRGIASDSLLVVLEHTGKYSYRFEAFLRSLSIDYCKLSALHIKRSLGVVRGKNDKIDAMRIADYGWLRRDSLVADPETDREIRTLQELLSLRSKLIRDRSGYICRIKEMKATGADTELLKIEQQVVDFLNRKVKVVNEKIKTLIKQNKAIRKTCELLMSIKGIGWIIAASMISCTSNFSRFKNARKFNCFAGLAPFPHESGSSIMGRARVSHLANKEIKTLLNLSASTAIQHDPEMRQYYQRRVAEGKRKMSCLNIIRCKLVARMFAVVKRQTPYQLLTIAA
jgi:transposase